MSKGQLRNNASFTLGKSDLTELAEGGGPSSLVDQIFMLVAGAIQTRKVSTGTRMPSVRQLADDCQISRDTAARAYDKLVAHGLLESRRGSGYYVKSAVTRKAPERTPERRSLFYPDGLGALSKFRLMLQRPAQSLVSRSGMGTLPEDWIDEAGIAGALRTVARGNQRGLALAGDPQGHLPLRHQLQLKLQDLGVRADPGQIIVTSGATDALNLVILSFLRTPGERVLVEQPCQPVLIDRMLSCGLDFAHVPRQADGPDLDVLRAMCQEHRPRYFFCNSALHNPTGGYLAPHKAFQILRLAEEFNLTIVEDDTYSDLVPQTGGAAATRLASLDQLQRVIYIGSFSKTLAPGLRVGHLAASPERIEWMATYRALNCLATNSLAERTVYRLLSEGNYRHHCEQLRAKLADARPHVADALREIGMSIEHEPDSGLFLWADLGAGVDAFAVAQRLLEQGHLLAPGQLFSGAHPSHLRLNIAATLGTGALEAIARLLGR